MIDQFNTFKRFAAFRTEEERLSDDRLKGTGTGRGTGANRDPITGAPGAHPVGTGVGAAGAGTTGAVIGTVVGGPVGGIIGAVVGSIAGGLGGKAAAEALDPTREDAYWRDNHKTQNWYDKNYSYDDYSPAVKSGYEGYGRHGQTGKTYDQAEVDLKNDWERTKGKSRLTWEQARGASRSAWKRLSDNVERAVPGDADRDGK